MKTNSVRSCLLPVISLLALLSMFLSPGSFGREVTGDSWNVNDGPTARLDLDFFQGESIEYTQPLKDGRSVYTLNTNTVYTWEIRGWSDYTNVYALTTGSVASVTNGTLYFALTGEQANLAEGTYLGFLKAIHSDGKQDVLAGQRIKFEWSEWSMIYDIVDPLSAPYFTQAEVLAIQAVLSNDIAEVSGRVDAVETDVAALQAATNSLTVDLGSLTSDFQILETNAMPKTDYDRGIGEINGYAVDRARFAEESQVAGASSDSDALEGHPASYFSVQSDFQTLETSFGVVSNDFRTLETNAVKLTDLVQSVSAGTSNNVVSGAGVAEYLESEISALEEADAIVIRTEQADIYTLTNSDIYVFLGQSNMQGSPERSSILVPVNFMNGMHGVTNSWIYYAWGTNTSPTLNSVVKQQSITAWGIEVGVASELTKYANLNVNFVKLAMGSTQLASTSQRPSAYPTWNPDETNLPSMFSRIYPTYTNALASFSSTGSVKAIVWMQGESDCYSDSAPLYYSNLTNLIYRTRALFGNQTIPFVICGLNYTYTDSSYEKDVRYALRRAALEDKYSTYVEMFDLPVITAGSAHYSAEGYWMASKRIAGAIRSVLSKNRTIDGGLDVLGAVRGRHGSFDHMLYGHEITGDYLDVDNISDKAGSISTLSISAEGLEFFADTRSNGLIDLTGKQIFTAVGSVSFTNDFTDASREYAFKGVFTNNLPGTTGSPLKFSFSYWIRNYTNDYSGSIVDLLASNGTHYAYYGLNGTDANNIYTVWGGVQSPKVVTPNSYWSFVVETYEHSGGGQSYEHKTYVNSVLVNTYAQAVITFNGLMAIGGPLTGADTTYFLDDFCFWSKTLSDDQVKILYSAQSRGMSGIRGI